LPQDCQCPSGYQFIRNKSKSACVPCPAGTFKIGASNTVPCTNCELGKYSTGTSPTACLQCPSFTSTVASKSAGVQSCLCVPGFSGPPGGPCTICPFGKYSTSLGRSACLNCSAGTYFSLPNVSAVASVDGFCRVCPSFSSSRSGSISLTGCLCNAGYILVDPGDGYRSCAACRPGSFSYADSLSCIRCSVGTYSESEGAKVCTACPPFQTNLFNGSRSQSDCICQCGYYSSPGSTTCSACPAGKAKDTKSGYADDCKACPADRYTDSAGTCYCSKQCPANSNSAIIGAGAFCTCNAGFGVPPGFENLTCVPCPSGFYRDEDDQVQACRPCLTGFYNPYSTQISCSACPFGKSTFSTGTVALSLCVCDKGYYCGDRICSICLPCPAGSYKSTIGILNCTFCENQDDSLPDSVGQVSSDACLPPDTATVGTPTGGGNVYVTNCPPGQELDPSNPTRCRLCSAGSYKPQADPLYYLDNFRCSCCPINTYQPLVGSTSSSSCLPCPEGSKMSANFRCVASISQCMCPTGKYNVNFFPWCADCPAGSYSNSWGATQCTFCEAGKFQSMSGSTVCSQCPPGRGTWSIVNSYSAMILGAVYVSDCKCNSGYSSKDSNLCIDCAPGTYRESSTSFSCISCGVGKYSTAYGAVSSATCKECFVGSTTRFTATNSSDFCTCKPGWYQSSEDFCLQCSPGKYKSANGPQNCIPCEAGEYQMYPGSSMCIPCPENSNSEVIGNDDPSSCYCNAGFEYISGVCASCNVGQYKVSESNIERCTMCPSGTYTLFENATAAESCIGCPDNTMPFTLTDPISGSSIGQICSCLEGFYLEDEECQPCSIGTYKDLIGDFECTPCGEDYYGTKNASNSSSGCSLCPEGTWTMGEQINAFDSSCVCKPGFFPSDNGLQCIPCKSGTYKSTSGPDQCKSCPMGKYSFSTRTGVSECTQCPPNSVTKSAGQFSRSGCMCAPGFTGWAGGPCVPCQAGEFKSTIGSDSCVPCPIGSYGTLTGMVSQNNCSRCAYLTTTLTVGQTNRSSCVCEAGYSYTNISTQMCRACPPGKFKNSPGNYSCQDCQAGLFSVRSAMSRDECTLCPIKATTDGPGKNSSAYCQCETGYINVNPQGMLAKCNICPYGKYFSNDLRLCVACTTGRYWFFNGSTYACHSLSCPPGKILSGQSCLCQPGYYSAGAGDTSCTLCSLGTYSSSSGSRTCSPCEYGKYSNATALTPCFSCRNGFTTTSLANISNLSCICKEGYEMIGALCLPCSKGSFKTGKGNQRCSLCPRGTYADTLGQSDCMECSLYATTVTTGSVARTNCQCFPGYHLDPDSAACLPCPVSTYKENNGSGPCSACPEDFTTESAAATSIASCKRCSTAECNTVECFVRCQQCTMCLPFYEYDQEDCSQTADTVCNSCEMCEPGQRPTAGCSATKNATCECCSAGEYAPAGVTSCISCGRGKYSASQCSTNCSNCARGKYQSGIGMTAESDCLLCDAGTFMTALISISVTDCSSCTVGTYSLAASTACSRCDPGKYASGMGTSYCTECSRGRYQTFFGQISSSDCVACIAGEFLGYAPASTCLFCPSGTFQSGTGMADSADCKLCEAGKYLSAKAATSAEDCIGCAPGLYQSAAGSTSKMDCQECSAGKYSTAVGASAAYWCECCETVSLEPRSGATVCATCQMALEPCRYNPENAEGRLFVYDSMWRLLSMNHST
jgi:hypothetical protein